jgi:hypothetical protein
MGLLIVQFNSPSYHFIPPIELRDFKKIEINSSFKKYKLHREGPDSQ